MYYKKTKVYLVKASKDENEQLKQQIAKNYFNLESLEAKDSNLLEKLRGQAKEIP